MKYRTALYDKTTEVQFKALSSNQFNVGVKEISFSYGTKTRLTKRLKLIRKRPKNIHYGHAQKITGSGYKL